MIWIPIVPAPFVYNAWVLAVHDGDTLSCRVDRGNHDYSDWDIRLLGCNARELADPGGGEARDNLRALLPAGAAVVLETVKPDKYGGRWNAHVWLGAGPRKPPLDVVRHLIDTGWAAPWNGGGVKPVPPWPRPS